MPSLDPVNPECDANTGTLTCPVTGYYYVSGTFTSVETGTWVSARLNANDFWGTRLEVSSEHVSVILCQNHYVPSSVNLSTEDNSTIYSIHLQPGT